MAHEKRIFGLDLLRAIAILLVIISHSAKILHIHKNMLPGNTVKINNIVGNNNKTNFQQFSGDNPAKNDLKLAAPEIHKRRSRLWALGALGVELFFVLSGFLIGNILIKIFLSTENFSIKEIFNFWMRRWLRTLPVYFIVLTGIIFIYYFLYRINIGRVKLSYYLFLQNLYKPHPSFFPEAWSLAVEEWFYLTVPIFLLITSVFFPKIKKLKLFLISSISYLIFFTLLRSVNLIKPIYGNDYDSGVRRIVIFRLDAIMYGVIVALLLKHYYKEIINKKDVLIIIGILGILATVYFMYYFEIGYIHSQMTLYRIFNILLLYSLLPFFFALFLPFANAYKTKNFKLNYFERIITHISKISYSMYLIHFTVFFIFFNFYPENYYSAFFFYILYWALTISIATIFYKYIEQPILQLRDRYIPGPKKI